MVGVRKRRWLLCGSVVWLVITVCILFTFLSDTESDPQTALTDDVESGGDCRPLGRQTLQMISSSNKTVFVSPWPDTLETIRQCAKLNYGPTEELPRSSVIITFHDTETISSLLHTIHSIIQRTSCQILEEIIVIDDFSKKDDLGKILDIYIGTVFSDKVKLNRNLVNLGLIRSRLKGARLSRGEVIVFMDSHSEVQDGWLEPLLYEIKKNRKTLAHSFIDWMEKPNDVWQYKRGASNWIVYFDWRLTFGWQPLPKQEEANRNATDPLKSKAIIGAYAAIDRRFFKEIGEFDEGMQFWGGENIDLSIRVWLFGGQVLCVPCSRVAHLEGANSRAYRSAFTSVIERNYKRVVEVWFDEYKTYFYQYFPTLIPVDAGNLEERMKVKAKALYNFTWFLQNVSPELGFPDKDSFSWGMLKNPRTQLCLDSSGNILLSQCASQNNQIFYWSKKFELRQPVGMFNLLPRLENREQRKVLTHFQYIPFFNNDLGSKWIHWKNGPMMEQESALCLSVATDLKSIEMVPCNYTKNPYQIWEFERYMDQYFEMISGNNRSIEYQYHKLLSTLLAMKSASSDPVTSLTEVGGVLPIKSQLNASESAPSFTRMAHHKFIRKKAGKRSTQRAVQTLVNTNIFL